MLAAGVTAHQINIHKQARAIRCIRPVIYPHYPAPFRHPGSPRRVLRLPRFRASGPTKRLRATGPGPDGLAWKAIYSPA